MPGFFLPVRSLVDDAPARARQSETERERIGVRV